MKKRRLISIGTLAVVAGLLPLAAGLAFAAKGAPLKPELAAKREMVRSQQEQRVTHEKRTAAAQALKSERLKIYQARQASGKQTQPPQTK